MNSKNNGEYLKIATLNTQGLRKIKHRRALFHHFKRHNFDIIAVQEAYLLNEDRHFINSEWSGSFHLVGGTKHSKGMLTLFGERLKNSDIRLCFSSDRIIVSSISVNGNPLYIINIYGPCGDKEKVLFFQDLTNTLRNINLSEEVQKIILGDTNSVSNNNLDIIAGLPHSNRVVNEFNSFIDQNDTIDIWRCQNCNNKEYTWSRTISYNSTFIARRLDFILVSNNLIQFCQNSEISSIGFSDHRLVFLKLDFSAFERGPSIFNLNTNFLNDIEFINQVKNKIKEIKREYESFNPHILWEAIKISIKSAAIKYGKEKSRENKQNKDLTLINLAVKEKALAQNPNDRILQSQIKNLKTQLELVNIKEAEGARIRAGIKWAESGEKNTAFFIGLERQRGRNDTIFRIKDKEGLTINTNDEILKHIAMYYKDLYTLPDITNQPPADVNFCEKGQGPSLSQEKAAGMELDITEAELHGAVASMNNGSSPGLDGIPAELYKVLWIDIKDSFLKCVKYSYYQKQLPMSQKHGVIKLLYKGKDLDRENISNWRPISLLNADYKIVAKILARRLIPVLDELLDQSQYAFVKGRNSGDMLRELDDLIELEKLKGKKSILLSVDYSKAFDTLSSAAIIKAMKVLGFREKFLEWVQILLKGRKSCVKNNNFISEFFNMERGVRQGCPLAPLLFICTVELLGRNIRNDPNIKGILTSKNHRPVKIRQFADDTTFFLRDQIDFREVLSKIKEFGKFSGLQLNINKCMAMVLDKNLTDKEKICHIKLVNKIKVLGVYFSNQCQPIELNENIEPKIEQLEKICRQWGKRNLTAIGKIIILKTFGISPLIHIINSIGIEQKNIIRINQIMFRFIWKKPGSEGRVIEKIKRSVLCNNLNEGGLKMIDLDLFQTGFFLKWGENLLSEERKEWKNAAKIFFEPLGGISAFKSNIHLRAHKGIELIKSKFWRRVLEVWIKTNVNNSKANNCISPSDPIFNNANLVFKGKVLFLPELIKRKISLVSQVTEKGRLLPMQELISKYGSYPGLILDFNILYNALLPVCSNLQKKQEHKNEQTFYYQNQVVGEIGRKKLMLLNKINSVPKSSIYWNRYENITYEKNRWLIPFKVTSEVKIQFFQWKISHRIFPCGVLLHKMGILPTENCQHCNKRETLVHLFFECPKNSKLWGEIDKLIRIETNHPIKLSSSDVIHGVLRNKNMKEQDFIYINKLILIGKTVISKSNFFQRNQIELFEEEYRQRFKD